MATGPTTASLRRARRNFWFLVVVSVLAVGALSDALTADASPSTGLRVAASGLILVVSVALAARVLLAVDRATPRARRTPRPSSRQPQRRRTERTP